MLKDIIMVQPYLSSYYETTKLVMQQQPPHSTTNKTANNNTLNDQKVLDNFSHLSAKENGYGNESKE